MSKLEQFNLEQMWLTYLNIAKIKLHELLPEDLNKQKAAFFAGVGKTLMLLTSEDCDALSIEETATIMEEMQTQVANFFDQQNFEQNG